MFNTLQYGISCQIIQPLKMVFLKLFNDKVNANSITSRVKKSGYNTITILKKNIHGK